MIIDLNVHLGHYPFCRLAHYDAEGLLRLMDRNGIDKAVVSSFNSVFYRHAHAGNEELMAEVKKAPDRLIPLITVDPTYAEWEYDLEFAVKEWKIKGVYLAPGYHPYFLSDSHGQFVLKRVAEFRLPVAISQRLEDRRRRHWMDTTVDLRFGDVAAAVRPFPELKLLLLNWDGLSAEQVREAGLAGRVLIDITRLSAVLDKEVPNLIQGLGIQSVGFGTDMPMSAAAPALLKLAVLDFLPPADRERIAWRNAAEFLNIPV